MVKPIRVLQVVTQMNRAGMESRLMDIYRKVDRQKVQFDFYTCRSDKGQFDEEIVEMGGTVFYSEPLSIKNIFTIKERFNRFLLEHKEYKIVHCHLNQWTGLVLQGAMKAGVPVRIAHSRTALEKNGIKNIVKDIIKKTVNTSATHKFAVSKKAGVWLFGEKSVLNGEVCIVPNSIDAKKFKFDFSIRARVRDNLNVNDNLVLIHVGNIRPEKNHKFLLDIFLKIKEEKKNIKLILVGADNMNGEIQRYISKSEFSNDVIFMGSRSDINELLQAGDVFVFPSFYEGFPGAVLEAQASGLPVVMSDTITSEVMLLDSTSKLSLNQPLKVWMNKILEKKLIDRPEAFKKIIENGYDINRTSNDLMNFYLNQVK